MEKYFGLDGPSAGERKWDEVLIDSGVSIFSTLSKNDCRRAREHSRVWGQILITAPKGAITNNNSNSWNANTITVIINSVYKEETLRAENSEKRWNLLYKT